MLCGATALVACLGLALPFTASAQHPAPEHAPATAQPEHAPPAAQGEEAAHESPWSLVARLTNFGILAGVLLYFLRSPTAAYLRDRGEQVRRDLVAAAELRATAAQQLEEIDRKLAALPGELESLKARGAQEIAAEDARIRQAADAERERLLEQTRRDIDLQLRVARRELQAEAANLAVGVASERIKRTITADDQARLVDRYVEQVRGTAASDHEPRTEEPGLGIRDLGFGKSKL